MTVKLDNRVFIFEFKVVDMDKTPGTAPSRSAARDMPTNTVQVFLKSISSAWISTGTSAISSGLSGKKGKGRDFQRKEMDAP